MELWKTPSRWSAKKLAAHQRGLDFLKSICDSSEFMELKTLPNGLPHVRVKGTSRRWYSLQAHPEETLIEDEDGIMQSSLYWNFDVRGAPRKTDLLLLNNYSVRLCIHPERRSRKLPIGDQLATLAMGLRDDRRTAVRIGLLAQFVIAPRDALIEVYKFTDEGAMFNDEVFPEYEPIGINAFIGNFDDETREISDSFALDEQAEANSYEHIAFQEWFDEKEEEVSLDEAVPWHHDEREIWDMEEMLLRSLD